MNRRRPRRRQDNQDPAGERASPVAGGSAEGGVGKDKH